MQELVLQGGDSPTTDVEALATCSFSGPVLPRLSSQKRNIMALRRDEDALVYRLIAACAEQPAEPNQLNVYLAKAPSYHHSPMRPAQRMTSVWLRRTHISTRPALPTRCDFSYRGRSRRVAVRLAPRQGTGTPPSWHYISKQSLPPGRRCNHARWERWFDLSTTAGADDKTFILRMWKVGQAYARPHVESATTCIPIFSHVQAKCRRVLEGGSAFRYCGSLSCRWI